MSHLKLFTFSDWLVIDPDCETYEHYLDYHDDNVNDETLKCPLSSIPEWNNSDNCTENTNSNNNDNNNDNDEDNDDDNNEGIEEKDLSLPEVNVLVETHDFHSFLCQLLLLTIAAFCFCYLQRGVSQITIR